MKKLITIVVIIVISASGAFAQYGSSGAVNSRATAMAKTYNSTAGGVNAIGINPAGILNTGFNSVELSTVLPLPPISVRAGTDFLSINEINYFFGGINGQPRYLNDADKQRMNNLFSGGGFIFANFTSNLFSLDVNAGSDVGAFAISVNDFAAGKFNFPAAIADIALHGNPLGKVYNLNDAYIRSWWIRNYSFSYARDIINDSPGTFTNIAAGFTVKMVQGYAYAATERVNTTFQTTTQDAITGTSDLAGLTAFSDFFNVKYDSDPSKTQGSYSPFPKPAGHGVGLDIGVSASILNEWRFSLAVTDIGSIKWDHNAGKFTGGGSIYLDDITDSAQTQNLLDKLKGTSERIDGFTTNLPTALRIGVSHYFARPDDDIPGTLLLAFDYNQGFNDLPGNSKTPRVSIGAEWKPMNWIPFIRTGFSFGGSLGFHWGFGLGIDAGVLDLNIGTSDLQGFLFPASARYTSISFDSRWKF